MSIEPEQLQSISELYRSDRCDLTLTLHQVECLVVGNVPGIIQDTEHCTVHYLSFSFYQFNRSKVHRIQC